MENKVFELVENNDEMVVLKVNTEDNLTVALNPYISGDMDYISVTKGENHILKVIRKDGTTFSFHWGHSGYTLISNELELLQKKVVEFIERELYIPLELNFPIKTIMVYYNPNYHKWQITMENKYKMADLFTTCGEYETKRIAEKIVGKPCKWQPRISITGMKVFDGIF